MSICPQRIHNPVEKKTGYIGIIEIIAVSLVAWGYREKRLTELEEAKRENKYLTLEQRGHRSGEY